MRDLKKITLMIVMVVIAALTVLGFWWFFFGSKARLGLEFEAITVEAEAVRRGSIVRRVNVVGVLKADNEVILRPEIEGKIKKFNFEGGTLVQKGDPLVEIEDDTFKAQVKEAQATLEFANAEFSRYERLAQTAAGPAKLKEKAYAEKLQAEARLELANIKLADTIIRAPFAGIVGLREFSVGSYINTQTELLSVVDVDPIKLDFRLPAVYLQSLSYGQEVKVTIDSMPDEIFRAKIDAIDPKIDATANSVHVRAVIPNPKAVLKPGLFARVNLVVGSKDDALLIPETAVLSRVEEEYVFRVVEVPINGTPTTIVVRVPVTTGLSEGGIIQIVRGLNEGDQVVTVGLSKVRDRYPVRVVEDVEADEALNEQEKAVSEEAQDAEEKAETPKSLIKPEAEKTEEKPAAETPKTEEKAPVEAPKTEEKAPAETGNAAPVAPEPEKAGENTAPAQEKAEEKTPVTQEKTEEKATEAPVQNSQEKPSAGNEPGSEKRSEEEKATVPPAASNQNTEEQTSQEPAAEQPPAEKPAEPEKTDHQESE